MKNLSFDFKASTHVGGGESPHFGRVPGTRARSRSLSAGWSNHSIGDGVGASQLHPVRDQLVRSSLGIVEYEADGTRSAWKVYTDAHPGESIKVRAYLVAEQSGNYRIDRLSLGAGVMYTNGNKVATLWGPTEASC